MSAVVDALVPICGAVEGGWLSRVDVFADVQGWVPDVGTMCGMVCPATFRPVYPSSESPETFQFGKGAVVVRVYNKTAEVAAKPSHWPDVWEAGKAESGYVAGEQVWRVEVQLRRDVLVQLGATTLSALSDPAALFRFGLEWASLREPDGADSNRRRWPVHHVWEWLLGLHVVTQPLERCRKSSSDAALAALIPQLLGLMVSVGSRADLTDLDEVACLVAGLGRGLVTKSGATFRDLVAARQLRDFGEVRV